jgi:hypothetical protein
LCGRNGNGLTAQGGIQCLHGSANFLRIAAGIGGFKRTRCIQYSAVVGTHLRSHLLSLNRLAVEGFVYRVAE